MAKRFEDIQEAVAALQFAYPDSVEVLEGSQPAIKVKVKDFLAIINMLKESGFAYLADLTAVEEQDSICVVYHLMSLEHFGLLRIKVELDKLNPEIPSLVDLWPAANVQEREAYDLMGVKFVGHPNLQRILCPDEFEGHPLRKDFKLETRRK
ncbi:NADH-quinone oxidoreductase subunit C [Zhaonella formicivorans]|jgi:NADH-quinone oxidoreductase subunit C|uniref:NADH-quinone oxidoreductase subunit C n=1 Tax=Zhaonella formicivorans TaxID=2528593 RepID=UPI0010F33328|nr:NADH-quinone oxidoreductase subunit C [Zhaonella formicivorans]